MATYLLTWNPDKWHAWREDELQSIKSELIAHRTVSMSWSTGRSKRPVPGDRVYWLRLGVPPKGIFAAGRAVSHVSESRRWDESPTDEGRTQPYVDTEIDELLNPWSEPILGQDELEKELPEIHWSPQSGGVQITGNAEVELAKLWHRTLAERRVGQLPAVANALQIRQNLRSFMRAMKARPSELVELFVQSTYFVYDPVSDEFVPNKWAAFRGMTGETYLGLRRLESNDRTHRGFNGGRATKILENVLGMSYARDSELATKLEAARRRFSGQETNRDWSTAAFVRLPATAERRFWWVNQGKTYSEESAGGYIWAPQRTKKGASPYYFWENVTRVSKGDVIFHYTGGSVRAVSIAAAKGYASERPAELPTPDWDAVGWRADCAYTVLANPIPLSNVQSQLVSLEIEQGPVNDTGRVNQGYLYEIPPEGAFGIAEHLDSTELPDDIALALELTSRKRTAMALTKDLNVIYFGPPGTGKTYVTAKRAVEIIDGEVPEDRLDLMTRYNELRESEQIAFVTFHQSYSYEEFVEGIRPVLKDDTPELDADATETSMVRYECRPGIFRRICERAEVVGKKTRTTFEFDPAKTKVWKMSLGSTQSSEDEWVYDDAIENNRILLGWGEAVDFSGCDDLDSVADRYRQHSGDSQPKEFAIRAVDRFKNKIAAGDLVVVSDGNTKFRAIGRVTGEYYCTGKEDYAQARPVEWLLTLDESQSSDIILRKIFSQATVYELKPRVLKIEGLRGVLSEETPSEPRRYVLIIDEINRGNIAKILGELITLLEPDKRIGAPNELRADLPYSGSRFGVPANLHVIGTMNTADRSIAFLDTALRRRFRFLEMMPDPAVVKNLVGQEGVVEGVDVAQLLTTINQRIELLYDRDHTLGHAYLLNVESLGDLRNIFVERLIPLLQEYFYDDWSKIGLVLGCPFDQARTKNPAPVLAVEELSAEKILGDAEEYETKARFHVNPRFETAEMGALPQFFNEVIRTHK